MVYDAGVARREFTAALPGALTEAGAVKVVKRDGPGKSKAALLPSDLLRMTTSVAVLSPVNAKSSVRAAAVNQATGRRRGRVELDTFAPAAAHIYLVIKNAFHPAIKRANAPSTA